MKISFTVALTFVLTSQCLAQQRYILRYSESQPLSAFLASYQLQLEKAVPQRPIYSLIDPLNRDPASLIQQISDDTDDDVSIELDQVISLPILSFPQFQTSDMANLITAGTRFKLTSFFGLNVPQGFLQQTAVPQTWMNLSWSAHGTGSGMVAVVDTGIDREHPVFQNSLEPGLDLVDPNGTGSETQGLSKEALAYINPTTTPLLNPLPSFRVVKYVSRGHLIQGRGRSSEVSTNSVLPIGLGHGTMVAGAVKLVAPGARILPIRAFAQNGTGRLFNVIRAIHEAEIRGAKVVNLSLNTYTYSPELEKTVSEVSDRGIILVASTGNDGLLNPPSYPASLPKVTGVASINRNWTRSAFSNYGSSLTWVSAPGEALLLPFPGKQYAGGWGTSFAAPIVSGLAAKLLQRNPSATYSDLQSALNYSTPLTGTGLGLGSVNIYRSIEGN